MLAEIYLLKLETKAREAAAEDRASRPQRDPRFVPLAKRT
jgi:hypothetical protein